MIFHFFFRNIETWKNLTILFFWGVCVLAYTHKYFVSSSNSHEMMFFLSVYDNENFSLSFFVPFSSYFYIARFHHQRKFSKSFCLYNHKNIYTENSQFHKDVCYWKKKCFFLLYFLGIFLYCINFFRFLLLFPLLSSSSSSFMVGGLKVRESMFLGDFLFSRIIFFINFVFFPMMYIIILTSYMMIIEKLKIKKKIIFLYRNFDQKNK